MKKAKPEYIDYVPLKPIPDDVEEGWVSGWISPSGDFYHCNYSDHMNLASRLFYYDIIEDDDERYLEEQGWIKISARKFLSHEDYYPNTFQLLVILKFLNRQNIDLIYNGIEYTLIQEFVDEVEYNRN
jgi:hypothetical protein